MAAPCIGKTSVLVTGASGFVGRALVARLAGGAEFQTFAAYRELPSARPVGVACLQLGARGLDADWRAILPGIDVVIHCAARVHVMRDDVSDPLAEFRRSNVDGTLKLAKGALEAGARRFVFVSSVKVNGEATHSGHAFSERDATQPVDPYSVSKLEAEQALFNLSRDRGFEVVVVRPPLVYGPGVKANFRSMMRWLNKGVPLPFGAIDNRRSLVALDNLVDLLVLCARHPAAANQVFMAGDGEDVSTSDLLRRTAKALGRSARLLPIPAAWWVAVAKLLGKDDVATRLCGNLQVDISKARNMLGWNPPIGLDEGLKKTAEEFLGRQHDGR